MKTIFIVVFFLFSMFSQPANAFISPEECAGIKLTVINKATTNEITYFISMPSFFPYDFYLSEDEILCIYDYNVDMEGNLNIKIDTSRDSMFWISVPLDEPFEYETERHIMRFSQTILPPAPGLFTS